MITEETFNNNTCKTVYKCGCVYNLHIADNIVYYKLALCADHLVKNHNVYEGKISAD